MNMTKTFRSLIVLLMMVILTTIPAGCEKGDAFDPGNSDDKENTTKPGNDEGNGNKSTDDDGENNGNQEPDSYFLSVEEFINCGLGEYKKVEGYIVGDCTKSFKYAEFKPPFTHEQALLIADSIDETDKSHIVAIQLPSGNERQSLNLVSHPNFLHRKIIFIGRRDKYLGMAGMKDLQAYVME